MLVGENGQGKTNLLEAIYWLTTLKPLRASRLSELVRFGAERAVVAADFEGPGGVRRVAVEIAHGVRTATLDGKVQESLDAYFEGLAAVCFAPDDLLLVKGGPDARRRFLDRAAFNRWPAVLGEAREYLRALRARNAALRALRGGGDVHAAEVEASFRAPLVRAGARLVRRRLALVAELAPRVREAFREIGGPGVPAVTLAYRAHGVPGPELGALVAEPVAVPVPGEAEAIDEAALAAGLEAALLRRLELDRDRGFTSAGPHVDDLALSLGGKAARAYASQGQQRALVLALKIAEIENLRAALGRPPLLLLDDVSSELDPAKNRYLLRYLAGLPAQAFLTTTDRALVLPAAGPDTAFFQVAAGALSAHVS